MSQISKVVTCIPLVRDNQICPHDASLQRRKASSLHPTYERMHLASRVVTWKIVMIYMPNEGDVVIRFAFDLFKIRQMVGTRLSEKDQLETSAS